MCRKWIGVNNEAAATALVDRQRHSVSRCEHRRRPRTPAHSLGAAEEQGQRLVHVINQQANYLAPVVAADMCEKKTRSTENDVLLMTGAPTTDRRETASHINRVLCLWMGSLLCIIIFERCIKWRESGERDVQGVWGEGAS